MTLRGLRKLGEQQGRRRFSKRLFWHVLREFSTILVITVLGFMTLFLVSALYDDLEDFARRGVPIAMTVRYFLLLQPDVLISVLPMSLLLASMYTVANAHKNNELTAIRASGVSIFHAFMPILLLGLLLTVVHFFMAEALAPRNRQLAREMHVRLTKGPSDQMALQQSSHLAYRNRQARRDWIFRDFSPREVSREVVVTQFRADGTVAWEVRAQEAWFDRAAGHWRFSKVIQTRFTDTGTEFVAPPSRVDQLDMPAITEDPETIAFAFSIGPTASMSIFDIVRVLRGAGEELTRSTRRVLRTYLYYRFSFPFSCVVAVLLGVPLGISRQRAATMRSIVLGVVVMALFYVCAQLFVVMGKGGLLPPIVAGCLPTFAFLGWGAWEMKRKL